MPSFTISVYSRNPLSSSLKGKDIDNADRLSHNMAKGEGASLFWVSQDITGREAAIAINKCRLIPHSSKPCSRLIFMMFLARNDNPPPLECGLPGDIWIATTSILLRELQGWVPCDMTRHRNPQHPIFHQRVLCLHPRHLFLQWSLRNSDRQWYMQKRWSLEAMRSIQLNGLMEIVSSPDIRPLLNRNLGELGSIDIARFLHAVLPLRLTRERTVGANSVVRLSSPSDMSASEGSISNDSRSGVVVRKEPVANKYFALDHEEERGGHAKPAEHDGPAEHADTAENEESFAVYEKTTILPPIPDGARQPWKIPVGFNHFKILTGFAMCIPCKDAERTECYQVWSKNTPRRCLHCSRYMKKCTFTVWSAEELKWPDKRRIANIRADKRPDELKGSSSEPCDASNTRAEEPEGPPHRSRLSPLAKKLGEMCNPWPGEPSKTSETRLVDVIAALISSKRAWLQDMFNEKEMYKRLKDYVSINGVGHCRAFQC
ncbi:hypothetical protein BC629DRAFT_1441892 [Irpex lacteus]|nr:hypothetical protein BC629DRAFT_1441892 [Irpex lacteus]